VSGSKADEVDSVGMRSIFSVVDVVDVVRVEECCVLSERVVFYSNPPIRGVERRRGLAVRQVSYFEGRRSPSSLSSKGLKII
jgi:hypothetical protein